MEFVLSQNILVFDTTVYRQRHGTAVGTNLHRRLIIFIWQIERNRFFRSALFICLFGWGKQIKLFCFGVIACLN